MEESFFSWYLKQRIKEFLKERGRQFRKIVFICNFTGLLLSLFAPYRRIKTTGSSVGFSFSAFFDILTYNLISRIIGFIIRSCLILISLLYFALALIYESILIVMFFISPPFSLSRYFREKSTWIWEKEIKTPEKLLSRLKRNDLYKHLLPFFDQELDDAVKNLHSNVSGNDPVKVYDFIAGFVNDRAFLSFLASKRVLKEDFLILVASINDFFAPSLSIPTPLGEELTYGYVNTIEKFGTDLTKSKIGKIKVNTALVSKIENIFNRSADNNVLLVGEPGVGRHATLAMLSKAISTGATPSLFGKRLIYLDTLRISSLSSDPSVVKRIFADILDEAVMAGNIILAIDQIDTIVTTKDERIDLSDAFLAHLQSQVPIIAIASLDDFNKYIKSNTSLLKFFEAIFIEEMPENEVFEALLANALSAVYSLKIQISLSSLKELLKISEHTTSERKQPEKSIVLLNDVISAAKNKGKRTIDSSFVDSVLGSETNLPVGEIKADESEKLIKLEEELHKRIVGQNEAISQVADAMRRERLGVQKGKRPIGSFIFLGPTGVGKTETAKTLAKTYFGSENNMVRIDMTQIQGDDAVKKIIGDGENPGILLSQIREKPFTVLLLDEFEKANTLAQNIFLQLLDEGIVKDALGKEAAFTNTIIIATSNAGAEFIREKIESGSNLTSKELSEYLLQKGVFSPELLNRFDGVVMFSPLKREEAITITNHLLADFSDRLKKSKNISLEITDELCSVITDKAFNPEFGARPIARFIQNNVENVIADMVLSKKINEGSVVLPQLLIEEIKKN